LMGPETAARGEPAIACQRQYSHGQAGVLSRCWLLWVPRLRCRARDRPRHRP
jgi:hypothetical protein